MHPDTVAVLLAAGGGTRFRGDGHKLEAALPATDRHRAGSVALRSLSNLLDAGFATVVVVTGRLGADRLGIGGATDPSGTTRLRVVHNPAWEDGQATSVTVGLGAARDAGATVAVIGLADQPGIEPAAWRAVATAAGDGGAIAVATYDGRRANPVALRDEIWSLVPATGDEGARAVMGLHPGLVIEVPCAGSPDDIDTVEDLRRWQSS